MMSATTENVGPVIWAISPPTYIALPQHRGNEANGEEQPRGISCGGLGVSASKPERIGERLFGGADCSLLSQLKKIL